MWVNSLKTALLMPERKICLAPMMDYTDRHDRYLLRLISKKMWLFTEMITSNTLLNADAARFLRFNTSEHPVAVQLGGSDPQDLAICTQMAEQAGYDEVNLNVGCPSDRVQSGQFGASLMATPELVAKCIHEMQAKVKIPVSVKCRLGIDDQDEYHHLKHFVQIVSDVGCEIFYIHARKAWLQGLSPKENRDVPPLNYDAVYQLKQDFPELTIIINGGIKTLKAAQQHMDHIDGCMIGREAYSNPYMLAEVDHLFYGTDEIQPSRMQVLHQYVDYIENEMLKGTRLTQMSRHVLGLFQGLPGAKAWRRHISENAHKADSNAELLLNAAKFIQQP